MNLLTPIEQSTVQRLRFRRQFVLAPRPLEKFADWQQRRVAGKWTIHAHPDLPLAQSRSGTTEVTLIGCCLNPDAPSQTDAEICQWLAEGTETIEDLERKTRRLTGRWVVLFCNASGDFLMPDPCAMRLVQYFEHHPDGPWCFTQPESVKDILQLRINPEAERELFSTPYYLNTVERWLPGSETHYESVKHLSPNHWLDLSTSRPARFWPREKLVPVSEEDGVVKAGALLRGGIEAAIKRFPLALPLTAGWDSRLLLAAAKPFAKDIYYYTLKYNSHRQDACDLSIPARLLAKLGLPHRMIECPAGMADGFARIFHENVTLAAYAHGPIVYGLFREYPQDRVCLKGMCLEIARCFLYKYDYPEHLDGRQLAVIACGAKRVNDYMIRHFAGWLAGAQPAATAAGYEVLDLFQWEQKVSNLVCHVESSFDITYETVALYNNRALLETLLAVPAKSRQHPGYGFYRKLIGHLWPETLSEPINPESFSESFQSRIKTVKRDAKATLRRFGLLATAKKLIRPKQP
ncbi:MAG: hypothetical protein RL088_1087 [Verrucomicrobiota bacterium]|jgi:hypothetical protein